MTHPSDLELDRLQRAFASASVSEGDPEVDTDEIFRAVRGDLDPERRRAVIDQVALNPRAAEAWRLAQELLAGTDVRLQRGALRRAPRRARLIGALSLASAAIAAGLLLFMPPAPPAPDTSAPALTRSFGGSGEPIAAQPTTCTRERCELAWSGPAGRLFNLRIMTESLEPLQDVDLQSATSYAVPSADLARVPAGGVLLWQVTARSAEGEETRSMTFRQVLP